MPAYERVVGFFVGELRREQFRDLPSDSIYIQVSSSRLALAKHIALRTILQIAVFRSLE